ncbi:U1 snRNA associated protein, putative [Plasmodium gallinaceum]|uniref:U1 snRNA associated protein, putative n=1 Tax=Plasmodium gallinaceum TaxID=5849 RepID=A0A1J1GR03_PLAGA|nr:U1 snRNA associated protein, putative [Plasmodium gallinaceum]CRG94722.1 U1 snRNA associated protein, putative [Plasmodium gallinaceum]
MEEMRSLLDSLMGKDRNEMDSQKKKYSFKDDNVCKYYLIDFCPHDLFPNTKSDIGRCKNIHSEVLKEQLENDENYKYYLAKYQQKFMKTLEKIIEVADIKIEKSKEKLKQLSVNCKNTFDKKSKIESINNHICNLLKQSEEAGEKGDLIKATSFNNQITMLHAEIKRLNEENDKANETNLKVCQVCGAMQSVGDVIQRFENHVNGKQHLGFEKIRNTLDKLKVGIKEREEMIEKHRKMKYKNNNHMKRKRNSHENSDKRRSSDYKSSKHHRSPERTDRIYHSRKSKRSRRHSSSYRSISNSSYCSNDRYRKHSSRHKKDR